METPIDREVAEIFTLVDNLLRELRKKRASIQKTSQLLAQYCLENPLTSYDAWHVLMMLRTMSEHMPERLLNSIQNQDFINQNGTMQFGNHKEIYPGLRKEGRRDDG